MKVWVQYSAYALRKRQQIKLSQYFHQERRIHPRLQTIAGTNHISGRIERAAIQCTPRKLQKVPCRRSLEILYIFRTSFLVTYNQRRFRRNNFSGCLPPLYLIIKMLLGKNCTLFRGHCPSMNLPFTGLNLRNTRTIC